MVGYAVPCFALPFALNMVDHVIWLLSWYLFHLLWLFKNMINHGKLLLTPSGNSSELRAVTLSNIMTNSEQKLRKANKELKYLSSLL